MVFYFVFSFFMKGDFAMFEVWIFLLFNEELMGPSVLVKQISQRAGSCWQSPKIYCETTLPYESVSSVFKF
jgi:hypothetical protein